MTLEGAGAEIAQVRKTYKLDEALLSEEAIDEERARLSGPDRQTMATVAGAISEELSRVKEALDIFMRGGAQSKVSDLAPHVATLKQVSDTGAIEKIVDEIIAANADKVAEYRSGKDKLFGFFVGLAMKASKGQANPAQLNEILKKKLAG